ncbi:hypothetical protein Fmac_010142 [Flemingia macrophylla]|uniref:Uncharacterized protein n=1 Tax=Flemingia macrophylla TaxID=520843 RepID=A0ABD1N291_9FABA
MILVDLKERTPTTPYRHLHSSWGMTFFYACPYVQKKKIISRKTIGICYTK